MIMSKTKRIEKSKETTAAVASNDRNNNSNVVGIRTATTLQPPSSVTLKNRSSIAKSASVVGASHVRSTASNWDTLKMKIKRPVTDDGDNKHSESTSHNSSKKQRRDDLSVAASIAAASAISNAASRSKEKKFTIPEPEAGFDKTRYVGMVIAHD